MKNAVKRIEEIKRLQQRYAGRGKKGKGRMLDEFCDHHGYERKHAVKLLNDWSFRGVQREKRSGPEKKYTPVQSVVEKIWFAAEQLCGKRLIAALPHWLPHYERHYGRLLPVQKKLLTEVSAATLDRMLAQLKAQAPRGLCGTKPGSLIRNQIPIAGEQWSENRVGFLEADTVAHCGASLKGNFIWSLIFTDLASAWTEGRAIWNKGSHGVLDATQEVELILPFPILGFDCDNGSEFMNWTLVRYFQDRAQPVRFTRSRPYHKDDNAHVEQKNWMWPRQLLGYNRLENPSLLPAINALYREVWSPLQNFFLPSMKLKSKHRDKSRWIRKHHEAITAYERLQGAYLLPIKQSKRLRDWYESLDPFELTQQLDKRLKPILNKAIPL